MKTITDAARALFPVAGHPAPRRAPSGGSSLLGRLLALVFAAAPLAVLVEAMAETA